MAMLAGASGCGIIDMIYLPPAEDTAQEIFEAANDAMADKNYVRAVELYNKLRDAYTFSPYTVDAELSLADDFPASIPALNKAKPVLQKFKGWKSSIKELSKYSQLPKQAKAYVDFIEDYTGTKVGIVSVGPERTQTFNREKIWK